ncbi:MAG TPA: S8 family serine peptidase, partial [Thermoanaerobaculia bacterium]
MPTIRFISHNCAAKAPRDQKNKPGKLPAFIEEVPSKRLFADDEVADFIAKNLPPKDWWIFGVRPEDGEDVSSERKREGQARATIKERLQEYDCRWLKSKANQTARAMIAKGGGVLYEDERDELELPDPYDDDGDYSGSETDPVTGFIESDAPLPHTQSQFAIAASRPDQKLYAEQNYLHAAPFGVDAPAGWNASGNDPSEVVLGVVDEGWTEEHVEFKNVKQFTTLGEIDPEGRGHGTAVLAIICAENAGGSDLFGVVPNLKSIVMSSPWMANGGHPTRGSKAAAIAWAACQLAKNNQRGNVLLI